MDIHMELQIDQTPNSLVTKNQSWYKSHLPWQLNLLSAFVKSWKPNQAYKFYQLAPNFPSSQYDHALNCFIKHFPSNLHILCNKTTSF